MAYDKELDAKPRFTNGTVVVGNHVVLHEAAGRLVAASGWAEFDKLHGHT